MDRGITTMLINIRISIIDPMLGKRVQATHGGQAISHIYHTLKYSWMDKWHNSVKLMKKWLMK